MVDKKGFKDETVLENRSGTKTETHGRKGKAESDEAHLDIPIVKMLKIMIETSFLSFLILELVYLFFLRIGSPKFPESLLACLAILIVGTALVRKFFAETVTLLTLACVAAGTAIMIDLLFGNSPTPHFFPFADSFQVDAIMMLLVTFFTYAFLNYLYSRIIARRMSRKHVALTFSVVGVLVSAAIAYQYHSWLVAVFDEHPWAITILVGAATAIGSYFLGTRRKARNEHA